MIRAERLNQQLGVFNPEVALRVEAINAQLGRFSADLGKVAGALAIISAGILGGTLRCTRGTPALNRR
ncbi:hypothetical protein [Corynebacterium bouchesdurhonense]|uniref:hypothetical protein n=1 Tax=Corynebacterium bouchesdurhonense TaxID=1720192 RepID=UPI001178A16B|nr:hypothetical protein [Corynebacterium bouchesdurhonense]